MKAANKNIKKMKLVVHETEQKTKAWEENCHKMEKARTLACKNLEIDRITEEMALAIKVARFGEITPNLKRKVT